MERELSREGCGFRDDVFTAAEIADCQARPHAAAHFAARFAAKEAVFKALVGGSAERLGWHDVEIVTAGGGAPRAVLHGKFRRLAKERGAVGVAVSLACTRPLAAACAVVSTRAGTREGRTEAWP